MVSDPMAGVTDGCETLLRVLELDLGLLQEQ